MKRLIVYVIQDIFVRKMNIFPYWEINNFEIFKIYKRNSFNIINLIIKF